MFVVLKFFDNLYFNKALKKIFMQNLGEKSKKKEKKRNKA